MKSYWIWNYGDFEIYHSNLVNSRRQEYGMDYPAFWKYSEVDRNVQMFTDIETEHDGYIKLSLNGKGYLLIDDIKYAPQENIEVKKGKHRLKICVLNLTGLPAAYIESNICASDSSWYTLNEQYEKISVGYEPQYDKPESNPETFLFEYERKYPISVENRDNGILYDFGKELFGFLYISNVNTNEKIHVSYGESLEEAVDVEHSILFEDIGGNDTYKLRQRAFHYIYLTGTKSAKVEADLEYLPLEKKGYFHCNDQAVNKIWDMCAYTLHINIREVLTEAIKRDRWLWGGDAYQAFKFNQYLFFDKEIVRRSTIALRGKEPFREHINTITDYSFYWVIGLYEYYQAYSDIDFIKFIYSKAETLMEFSAKRINKDGFITGKDGDWIFIDWSDIDKDGAVCAEQMLYIAANKAMAELSKLAGGNAKKYQDTVDLFVEKVAGFFWDDEKGAFIDCYESGKRNVTRHANIFAIMYDIATDTQKDNIIKNVLLNDEIPKITTPYFEGYELDVMGKIGNYEYIENMIKSYWKGMLDLGATTVWEEFDPKLSGIEHYQMYGSKYGKSLCHAWGASPVYLLGKYFLGVSQTSVGFETFEIRPYLGKFKYIEGVVPIKDGKVYVHLSSEKLSVMTTKSGGKLIFGEQEYNLEAGKSLELTI